MPFTATHSLAVVPLFARRLHLDPTCLVIGSMAPDFEYFARVKLVSHIGHTLFGLVVWCLPVTLVCAWLFHRVAKWPALRVAPQPIARRLAAYAERPWVPAWTFAAIASLVVSALLGAITHLIWDGLTHANMYGPRHFPWLRTVVDVPIAGAMVMHRLLQHGSTVIGSVVLLALAIRGLRRVTPVDIETGGRVVWLACVAAMTALAYAKMVVRHETDIGSLVVAPCCGLLYGAVIAGLFAMPDQRAARE